MEQMPKREIEQKVKKAIEHLHERDSYLLERNVNERSISHRLAIYLQNEFGDSWDVDCEYNRDSGGIDVIKRVHIPTKKITNEDTEAQTVYPDIIVHHRGTGDNLLVIEIKKTVNEQGRNGDLEKLHAYKQELRYRHTLYLQIRTGARRGVDCMQWDDEDGV